jgi:hypothetical protein
MDEGYGGTSNWPVYGNRCSRSDRARLATRLPSVLSGVSETRTSCNRPRCRRGTAAATDRESGWLWYRRNERNNARVPGTVRNRGTSTCLVTYMLSTYSLQGLHHGSLPEIFADKHALAVRPARNAQGQAVVPGEARRRGRDAPHLSHRCRASLGNPTLENITKLANALSATLPELFTGEVKLAPAKSNQTARESETAPPLVAPISRTRTKAVQKRGLGYWDALQRSF